MVVACSFEEFTSCFTPLVSSLWSYTRTRAGAMPAGNCMADAVSAGWSGRPTEGHVWVRDGGALLILEFDPGVEDDEGLFGGHYAGYVASDIDAKGLPWGHPFDARPWTSDLCASSWNLVEGRVTATHEDDGATIVGTVEDTFEIVGLKPGSWGDSKVGDRFVVRTTFTARRR